MLDTLTSAAAALLGVCIGGLLTRQIQRDANRLQRESARADLRLRKAEELYCASIDVERWARELLRVSDAVESGHVESEDTKRLDTLDDLARGKVTMLASLHVPEMKAVASRLQGAAVRFHETWSEGTARAVGDPAFRDSRMTPKDVQAAFDALMVACADLRESLQKAIVGSNPGG